MTDPVLLAAGQVASLEYERHHVFGQVRDTPMKFNMRRAIPVPFEQLSGQEIESNLTWCFAFHNPEPAPHRVALLKGLVLTDAERSIECCPAGDGRAYGRQRMLRIVKAHLNAEQQK